MDTPGIGILLDKLSILCKRELDSTPYDELDDEDMRYIFEIADLYLSINEKAMRINRKHQLMKKKAERLP